MKQSTMTALVLTWGLIAGSEFWLWVLGFTPQPNITLLYLGLGCGAYTCLFAQK